MSKHTYEQERINRTSSYVACQKALQLAQERLKQEGVNYPVYVGGASMEEYLQSLEAYANKEARYYNEALEAAKQAMEQRAQTAKKEWQQNYD